MKPRILLGLDIGSNSVGSAWIDLEKKEIKLSVTVFPAGVDSTDTKRGAPKNQKRRQARSARRGIRRRAQRKHHLRKVLMDAGLLPTDGKALQEVINCNPRHLRRDDSLRSSTQRKDRRPTPWHLRRDGLRRPLTPYEFGRVLIHLNQHRGALGVETDPEDPEEGKVKEAIDHTRAEMAQRNVKTFGELIADEYDRRRQPIRDMNGDVKKDDSGNEVVYHDAVRNRRDKFEFHADRTIVRDEFLKLWKKQESFDSELAGLLTDDLKRLLDDPGEDDTWRHRGAIFGQRRTYWDTGTLGRCDLEPTDQRCSFADMYAQEFRVIETANNIRIRKRGQSWQALSDEERAKVLGVLRAQKTGTPATIRRALGIHKKDVKEFYELNVERDSDREINTDWFYREIVHGAFGESGWHRLTPQQRDSVNRALLRFDPDKPEHAERLRSGAVSWWGLSAEAAESLVAAWRGRPRLDKRVNLSRRAIQNLLPYMNEYDEVNERWPTQIEARQRFSEDSKNGSTAEQRARYSLSGRGPNRAERHYLKKHADLLPPAPMLANPVVRKSVHEVRRHLNALIRRYKCKPDRIVVELARSATQSERVRNQQLANNRRREAERRKIEEDLKQWGIPESNWPAAVRRVKLCQEQKGVCPFSIDGPNSDRIITPKMAAEGRDVEVEHVIPRAYSGPTMNYNNLVLCFRDRNRNKGDRTPLEWLGQERFQLVLQRLGKTDVPKNKTKWENLSKTTAELEDWASSQLTDTAYASVQVLSYLKNALYDGEREGTRHVYTTKGRYTAILRRDWGLVETDLDRQWHPGTEQSVDGPPADIARKEKDRTDHVHHAIDAVAIAFAGDQSDAIQDLARFAQEQEKARTETGYWPKRERLPAPYPWESVDEFRSQVLDEVRKIVVAHRPVKRKLLGAFHEETAYGPVLGSNTLFTNRIRAENLTPNHLRVPDEWDNLSKRLRDSSLTKTEQQALRRQLAKMADPSPGKSGIVRDRALRDEIRHCLRKAGLDPNNFGKDAVKKLIEAGELRKSSGVPIRSVVLLRTNREPVVIRRKRWDDATQAIVYDDDPRTLRAYIGGNNHHIELRENLKTGRWEGEVVTAFDAAQRVRCKGNPAVDRRERDGLRFVMSLSEGEVIRARRKDRPTDAPDAIGFFVVSKIDRPSRIHFAPHWDARLASKQDRWDVTPADLKDCEPESGIAPYKVQLSPLGEWRRIDD